MKFYLFLFLLLPAACLAQVNITGTVLNATDGKPVPNASIFLSNATVGSKSAEDGTFTLSYVRPGQYEFVVSVVGFETYRQNVIVNSANIALGELKLTRKTTALKEVKIVAGNNDWERNFRRFKDEFIGTSVAAQDCNLTNYDALTLDYDQSTMKLTGSSNDFLEVENKYLGFKIKYILKSFEKDYRSGMLYFDGSALFEELPDSFSQKRRWAKRRREVYLGSSMHFLRSLIADSMVTNGFSVFRLIRKPNPKYVGGGTNVTEKYIQTLVKTPLAATDFVKQTDQEGLYALGFPDLLYVKYWRSSLSSIITIAAPYAFFDSNGIIVNPAAVITEGYWGRSRIAELLPVDYELPVTGK